MIRSEDDLRAALQAPIESERLDRVRRMIADIADPAPVRRRRWVTPLVAAATVATLAAGTVTAIALNERDRSSDPTPAATIAVHPSPTAADTTTPISVTKPFVPPLTTAAPSLAVRPNPASTESQSTAPVLRTDVAPMVAGKAQARTTYFTLDPASGFRIGPTGVTSNTAEIRNILLANGSQSGAAVDMEGPGDLYGLARTAGVPAVPLQQGSAHWATYRNFRYGAAAVEVLQIDFENGDQALVVPGGTAPASRGRAVEIARALRPGPIRSHDLPAVFGYLPKGYGYGGAAYEFGPGGRTWQWNSGHTALVSRGSDCTIGVGAVNSDGTALGGPLPAGIDQTEIKKIAEALRLHGFGDQSTWLPVPGP